MLKTQCLPCLISLDLFIDQFYNKAVLIRKAYRYRLKTKPKHEAKFRQFAGSCRFVWNKSLALQKELLAKGERCLSYCKLAGLLKQWKSQPETLFLNEAAHSQSLQQTLKSLMRAIYDAFDKTNPKRFPVFKKKGVYDSFRYPQGFKINGNAVYLPKIGWIPFYKSRAIEGEPKNITVSRRAEHWYISIQVELEVPNPVHPSTSSVGLDMGIAHFAAFDDGTFIEALNVFRKLEDALARQQRKLSGMVKFSKNWFKQKAKIAKIYIRIADTRNDFLHKHSTAISKNHALVMLEALKVSNMSKSAKGTVEAPGRNVKAKSGLNKAILDQGWSEFRRILEYKLLWRGGMVVEVPPQHTSQKCPVCHFISADNRKSQAVFRCIDCGYTANADTVAAMNIKAAGHAVLACGEMAQQCRSVKQEPPRANGSGILSL